MLRTFTKVLMVEMKLCNNNCNKVIKNNSIQLYFEDILHLCRRMNEFSRIRMLKLNFLKNFLHPVLKKITAMS